MSIGRQSRALDAIIRSTGGPQRRSVLDTSCGIGTQSIGLAQLGYEVTASDLTFSSGSETARSARPALAGTFNPVQRRRHARRPCTPPAFV